jgi:hypothetical protein
MRFGIMAEPGKAPAVIGFVSGPKFAEEFIQMPPPSKLSRNGMTHEVMDLVVSEEVSSATKDGRTL